MIKKCPLCIVNLSVDTGELSECLSGYAHKFSLFCHHCDYSEKINIKEPVARAEQLTERA